MPWDAASAAGGTWGSQSAATATTYGALSGAVADNIILPANFPIVWGVAQSWPVVSSAASVTWTAKGAP